MRFELVKKKAFFKTGGCSCHGQPTGHRVLTLWTASVWRRSSTFFWKASSHRSQAKGLTPACLRMCVIKFELCEKALLQTRHLCGFSPKNHGYTNNIRKSCKYFKIKFSKTLKKIISKFPMHGPKMEYSIKFGTSTNQIIAFTIQHSAFGARVSRY